MKNWMHKIKLANLIRRVTQIISFILLPGLFTSLYYAIKEIYTSILGGSITTATISAYLFVLIATLLTTVVLGRFFCGFFCSFGAMGDFVWFISKKTVNHKVKISEKMDGILKLLKYGLLLFIVVVIWTLKLVTIDSTSNPWNIFGMYSNIKGLSSLGYLFTIGGLLLLLIIIGSFFIERFFCRYLCPLGAIFTLLSRFRLIRIKKNREKCGSCSACTKQCTMGIPLYKHDIVTSGECIQCFACVNCCPKNNAKVNPAPAVASVASVAAISSLLYAGSITSTATTNTGSITSASTTNTDSSNINITQTKSGNYTDGTYTGTGTGFRGETEVSVTVKNGYITDITVLSYEDDNEYFTRAQNNVIASIIENQDMEVDTVSGATFSSNGIIEAVSNALGTEFTNPNSTMSGQKHHGPGGR